MKITRISLLLVGIFTLTNISCSKNDIKLTTANEELQRPVNFSTDNWTTFIAALNMGKKYFKKAYLGDKEYIEMIGSRRTLTLNEKEYNIELIDIEKDKNTNNEKALLTFQFVEPINATNFSDNTNRWYKEDSVIIESNIRKFCNEELFNSFPDSIKDNVASVIKKTIEYNGVYKESNYTSEKVYIPSLSEANFDTKKEDEGGAYSKITTFTTNAWFRSPSLEKNDESYIYDINTNEIRLEKVNKEDISIYPIFSLEVKPKNTTVTLNLNNCTSSVGNVINATSGSIQKLKISKTSPFKAPTLVSPSTSIFDAEFDANTGDLTFTMPSVNGSIGCSTTYREIEELPLLINLFPDIARAGSYTETTHAIMNDNSFGLSFRYQFTQAAFPITYDRSGDVELRISPTGYSSTLVRTWDGASDDDLCHNHDFGWGYVDNGWDAAGGGCQALHPIIDRVGENVKNDFVNRTSYIRTHANFNYNSSTYDAWCRDQYVNEVFYCRGSNKYYRFNKVTGSTIDYSAKTNHGFNVFKEAWDQINHDNWTCNASDTVSAWCNGYKITYSFTEVQV